jgi:hypothetical protein
MIDIDDVAEFMIVFLACASVGMLILAVIVGVGLMVLPTSEDPEKLIASTPLCGMRDDTGNTIYGRFSLGYGSVESSMQYIFYTQTSSGAYKSVFAPIEDSVIFENNTEYPRIDRYEYHKCKTFFDFKFPYAVYCKNKIYVPQGSIVKMF